MTVRRRLGICRAVLFVAFGSPSPANAVPLSARERFAVARALCESPPVARGRGFRCDCPSYTELAKERGALGVGPFFPGQVSGRGRHEIVVGLAGCESVAGSSATFGGRALVRRTPAGYKRVFYERLALGACTAVRSPSRRTFLICRRDSGTQGVYPVEFFSLRFHESNGTVTDREDTFFDFHAFDVPYVRSAGYGGLLPILRVERFAILGRSAYARGRPGALSVLLTVRSRVDCVKRRCLGVNVHSAVARLRYDLHGSTFRLARVSVKVFRALAHRIDLAAALY